MLRMQRRRVRVVADNRGQAKPTHQNIIRLAPPLVISEQDMERSLQIIREAVAELPDWKGETDVANGH